MNSKIARSIAFPALTLVVGMGIGAAWNRPVEAKIEVPDTELVPPFSTQSASSDLLKDICFRSAAYAGLIKNDRATRQDLGVSQFNAMPYSDRGVICRVVGKLRIVTHEPGSQSITERSESVQVNILASVTGSPRSSRMNS